MSGGVIKFLFEKIVLENNRRPPYKKFLIFCYIRYYELHLQI